MVTKLGSVFKYLKIFDNGEKVEIVIKYVKGIINVDSEDFEKEFKSIYRYLSEREKDLLYDLVIKSQLDNYFINLQV